MSEERIFSGNTVEEVAKAFAETVSRNYLRHLQSWQATAMDDLHEYNQWQLRIESEPQEVERNAFEKILKIMKQPQENIEFFSKWWIFRSKDVISITRSSGFYESLLPGKDVEQTVSVNVEYLINKRRLTVIKKIYSQDARL